MAGSSLSTPRTDASSCTRKYILVLSYRTDTDTDTHAYTQELWAHNLIAKGCLNSRSQGEQNWLHMYGNSESQTCHRPCQNLEAFCALSDAALLQSCA